MKCENCDECVYVGEGDSLCMERQEIVLTDFGAPTDNYLCCREREGK